jgi:hypothetical protein
MEYTPGAAANIDRITGYAGHQTITNLVAK